MGRSKKLLFKCSCCEKVFKRKINLKKHMISHSTDFIGQSRRARMRSNWCHVCRQSFAESEYKLHIRTEHQYDSSEMDTDDSDNENKDIQQISLISGANNVDFYSSEGEYVLPSTDIKVKVDKFTSVQAEKRTKKKTSKLKSPHQEYLEPSCSFTKIKIEPPETFSDLSDYKNCSGSSKKNTVLKSNATTNFITCNKCDLQCKGQRGLKIHLATHKRKSFSIRKHKNSSVVSKIGDNIQLKQEQLDETSEHCDSSVNNSTSNPNFLGNNGPSNLGQNTPTGLIYNMFPFQGQTLNNMLPLQGQALNNVLPIQSQTLNNLINIGNQSNIQIVPVGNQSNIQVVPVANPNTQAPESIPKFDFDCEKYIKWLKKFIYRCKQHKYPLTSMYSKSLSYINDEITVALADPFGSMNKRSVHFYFMRIQSVVSEIMLGHMRHTLSVVRR